MATKAALPNAPYHNGGVLLLWALEILYLSFIFSLDRPQSSLITEVFAAILTQLVFLF
jgi:hypothetical protein